MTTMQSAFAKLDRAKSHRDALRADVEAYRAREPHDWILRQDSYRDEGNRITVSIEIQVKEATPVSWPVVIGDILSNLEAALDHAVFGHIAGRNALTATQEKSLYFPIKVDAAKWPDAQKSLAPLMDPAVLKVIEQSQPFHFTAKDGGPEWHPLRVMNELVNRDKHRAVRTVSYVNEEFTIEDSDLPVINVDTRSVEMTEGAVVATVTFELPPPVPVRLTVTDPADRLTITDLHIVNGYIEKIELPNVADTRPLLAVMDGAVSAVEKVLNNLKTVNC